MFRTNNELWLYGLILFFSGIAPGEVVAEEQSAEHWAFRPIARPGLPKIANSNRVRTAVDYFVQAKLEEKGLEPAGEATPLTLLRRLTFDLTGLPPTPEEITRFLSTDPEIAYRRAVDSLLGSPQYGERWGRHWLDVARYADSNGLDENIAHGNAWRYRDYVIRSFNSDLSYQDFLIEQLAGDLIGHRPNSPSYSNLVATGFLSLGPKVLAEVDELKMEMDIIDEQVDTVGKAFLGLTLGCARCHDHKFDPITQDDYYSIAGIFKSTRTMEHFTKIARWNEVPLASKQQLQAVQDHKNRIESLQKSIDGLIAKATEQVKQLGDGTKKPTEDAFPEQVRKQLKQLREEKTSLEKATPSLPTAMVVADSNATDLRIHLRGSHLNLGTEVDRGFPEALGASPGIPAAESGRRQLAEWLVSRDHPLTSRVIVNRIWRWHFGRGLVSSTENFGILGSLPSHPELLDWLARELIQTGWSLKAIHRTIVMSSTYRSSARATEATKEKDPANIWLARAPTRRLEAEAIRDALLSVAGQLDRSMYQSMLHVANRAFIFDHTSIDNTPYETSRRSIYLPVIRNHLHPVYQLFDYSDASIVQGNRSSSVVAPQALFFLNSELVVDAASGLSERLGKTDLDDPVRVDLLYKLAYGREADDSEISAAIEFLKELEPQFADEQDARTKCWQALCQVILSSNEFIYCY